MRAIAHLYANFCVDAAYSAVHGDESSQNNQPVMDYKDITPKILKGVLDDYVIGQERAKKGI